MNFFDYIRNESFFRPLNLKYRRVYYDCIQILIDKAKELPVLYESDAKDSLTLYLRNAGIKEEGEDADEGGGELRPPEILALFRECGWLMPREIGRSGEYVVNLSTDCRRIMDFLRKISERKGEGMMSNRIFSMYEIMKSAFDEDSLRKERPYTNILVPLLDNETELKNELTDLKDSISNIMKAVVVFQDMNSFGQYIMKDEMLDRFFHEYFFIKNNGLIPAQISFIKNRLRMLRQGEIFERMIAECAGRFQMSMEEAEEKIEHYFAELQYFLSVEYEENMELIDTRINNYYNLANTRIMLMAGNGIRLEAVLNDFLNAMPELGEEKQDEAMERLSGCTRIINQKYVGYRSFEKKKRLKNEGENIGLSSEELSEEEKLAQTEELFRKVPNRYSVEKVSGFMDVQMEGQEKISIKEKPVRTKEEALMYTAAMLYAGNGEFPYQVQITDEEVEKEVADMSNIVISRK
mgnify:FL=1